MLWHSFQHEVGCRSSPLQIGLALSAIDNCGSGSGLASSPRPAETSYVLSRAIGLEVWIV